MYAVILLLAALIIGAEGVCNLAGTESESGTVCVCKPGWLGDFCQFECPGRSTSSVCSGRGVCSEALTGEPRAICTCNDPNITGDNCELGCEKVNGLVCNGKGVCTDNLDENGTAVSSTCVCSGNWAGLGCGVCVEGWFGTDCLFECPGRGPSLICSGHGTCNNNETAPECTCDMPYIREDCSATHYGIAAAPSTLTHESINVRTTTGLNPVANTSFTLLVAGYTIARQEFHPMEVKISEHYGHCFGDDTTIGTVDPMTNVVQLMAPGAGNYTVCARWRTDWELLPAKGSPSTPYVLTVDAPSATEPFQGYQTCHDFISHYATQQPDVCGCYYEGNTTTVLRLTNIHSNRYFSLPNPPTVYQGCCSLLLPHEKLGNTTTGGWGVCLLNWRLY